MADNQTKQTVIVSVNGEEARNELDKLKKEADMWRDKMIAAHNAGDNKKFKEAQNELKKCTSEIRNLQRSAVDVESVMKNLAGASVKDLNKALRQMTNELNSGAVARNSEQWKEYQERVAVVREELSKISNEGRAAEGMFARLNNSLNKWGGLITSSLAALTGLGLALQKLRKMAHDKEDSQANLQALTGLDDKSIKWLTRQAEELSTTMDESGLRIQAASKDILEAYMLVGSAKPELLTNKQALNDVTVEALRLATAAKMGTAEAVDALTLSLNEYSAKADDAAKYTNVLAAGSKMGAANVEQQTSAIIKAGVAAAGADVPIEQLVGTIETLAEFGIKSEVAGTGIKSFLLKLEGGAKDTRPSVVGLQTALENLSKKSMDAAELQKTFGLEAYSVAKVLIDNAEKVKSYTEAVTGTSIATEQAAINSDTASAKSAQLKNKLSELGQELMIQLDPTIVRLTSRLTNMTQVFVDFLAWANQHKAVITAVVTALLGYTIALEAHNIKQKLIVLWNEKIIATSKQVWATLRANPYAAIASAIVVLIGVMAQYYENQKKVNLMEEASARAKKKTAEAVDEEAAKIEVLRSRINNESNSREKRNQAIKELQAMVPGYHASISEEGKLINENTSALDEYLKALERTTMAEAIKEEMTAAIKQRRTLLKEAQRAEEEYNQAVSRRSAAEFSNYSKASTPGMKNLAEGMTGGAEKSKEKQAANALDEVNRKIKEQEELINDLKSEYQAYGDTVEDVAKAETKSEPTQKEDEKTKIAKLELAASEAKKIAAEEYESKKINTEEYAELVYAIEQQLLDDKMKLYSKDSVEYIKLQKEKAEKAAERAKKNATSELAEQKKLDAEELKLAKKKSDEEQKVIDQQQKQANALLKKYLKTNEGDIYQADISALDDALNKKLISMEQYEAAVASLRKKMSSDTIREYNQDVQKNKLSLAKKKTELKKMFKEGKISAEDYNSAIEKAEEENTQNVLSITQTAISSLQTIMSSMANMMQAACDKEVAQTEAKWDAIIEANEKAGKDTTELEEQKEAEIAKIKTEYSKRQQAMEIAQAIASGAMMVVNACASAAKESWWLIPVAAALATATTAMQIATIKDAHEAEEQGYYEGGYTGGNSYREEAGVVHEGEFVANHEAVNNPALRPILNLIDYAQKNNKVASLTGDDIALAASRSAGYYDGGYTTKKTITPQQVVVKSSGLDKETKETLKGLKDVLEDGVFAYTTIDGPNGNYRKTKRFEKLMKNKGR